MSGFANGIIVPNVGTAGAPTTGGHAKNELWVDSNGVLWVCTVAGTPGTWVNASTSGDVTSVTAADTSIVIAGTATAPTVAAGTLDVIATNHPPAAAVPLNAKKITGLANGTAATDAAAFGQITAANAAAVALSTVTAIGDLIVGTGSGTVGRLAVGAAGTVLVGGSTPAWAVLAGTVLATTQYSQAGAYTTTSTTFAAVDNTHVAASITAPASGKVLVRANFVCELDAAADYLLAMTLWDATGNAEISSAYRKTVQRGFSVNHTELLSYEVVVSGLTPGNTYNFGLGWAVSNALATGVIQTQATGAPPTTEGGPLTIIVVAL